jgi:hypothetical protein
MELLKETESSRRDLLLMPHTSDSYGSFLSSPTRGRHFDLLIPFPERITRGV